MIFSVTDSLRVNLDSLDLNYIVEKYFSSICEENDLLSYVFVRVDDLVMSVEVVGGVNFPIAPLNGSLNEVLKQGIIGCFENFKKPHIHKMSSEFISVLNRVTPSLPISPKIIFIPISCESCKYVFLGFQNNIKLSNIPEGLEDVVEDIATTIHVISQSEKRQKRFNILEKYVKEVGHDIASNVQSTISKLSNIYRGLYQGNAIFDKSKEAYDETMNVYSIAENLGFTVDPEYNIKNGDNYDITECLKLSQALHYSEARERNIEIKINGPINKKIIMWGDRKGIELAIGHYLLNAIKYSFGSKSIYVNFSINDENVSIEVVNTGINIDSGDLPELWDFGFRGDNAYEKHVNGSGIGLYTVRKIITAHGGFVNVKSGATENVVKFTMTLPRGMDLSKAQLIG